MITPILRTVFLLSSLVTLPVDAVSHKEGVVTSPQICESIISTVIGRNPETIKTDKVQGDVVQVTYIRPDDSQKWQYQCKIVDNSATWVSGTESWKEAGRNSQITFSTLRDKLYIVEKFYDGSINSRSFQLNKDNI